MSKLLRIKSIIVLVALFFCVSSSHAISPLGEVWSYHLKRAPDYALVYAYKDAKTYLYMCAPVCNFYRVPCGIDDPVYGSGLSCAIYVPLYASLFQLFKSQGMWQSGWMQSYFAFGTAWQLSVILLKDWLPIPVPIPIVLFMDIYKIGDVEDYPDDQFIDELPFGLQFLPAIPE